MNANPVALVTGANKEIGLQIAKDLATSPIGALAPSNRPLKSRSSRSHRCRWSDGHILERRRSDSVVSGDPKASPTGRTMAARKCGGATRPPSTLRHGVDREWPA